MAIDVNSLRAPDLTREPCGGASRENLNIRKDGLRRSGSGPSHPQAGFSPFNLER
jgi:hypothetical protein